MIDLIDKERRERWQLRLHTQGILSDAEHIIWDRAEVRGHRPCSGWTYIYCTRCDRALAFHSKEGAHMMESAAMAEECT